MYKCEKCNREFKIKQNYQKHLIKKISCNRVIKCEICNKIFKLLSHLKSHLNRKNKCIKLDLEKENLELIYKKENLELKLEKEEYEKLKEELNKIKQENKVMKHTISNNTGKYEFIYIVSTVLYLSDNIVKIGRTCDLKSRLSVYNTGSIKGDRYAYYYILKCSDAIKLEKDIFDRLEEYKIGSEMYQLEYKKIIKIINELYLLEN